MSHNCIFCKIIAGEIPCEKVFEDENYFAFKDIHPKAPVHILVVPKKHIRSVGDFKEDEAEVFSGLFVTAQKVANQLGVKEKGFRSVINSGADSGQEVDHLHLHILGGGKLRGMG